MKNASAIGVIAAAGFLFSSGAFGAPDRKEVSSTGFYDCRAASAEAAAPSAGIPLDLTIEFDERIPLARVNEEDSPADFAPSHIRIRLDAAGPVLTIGRVTGRLLASSADGRVLAIGRCIARVTV